MKLNSLNDTGATSPIGPKNIEPSQPYTDESQKVEHKISPTFEADKTSISSSAKEISDIQEMVRLHREAFGETTDPSRSEKLDMVRQKISEGYYDSDEGIDNLANRLVEGTMSDVGKSSSLETIQSRTNNGYYDRPAVVDKTAENMIKQVVGRKYQI